MRIKPLHVGVESITQWEVEDEVHLPKDGPLGPKFLPIYRPLDEILRRPSLDERLPNLLQPELLDPDLLQPSALSDARMEAAALFARAAVRQHGRRRELLELASNYLEEDVGLDDEIRTSLAMLLRG